jgi:HSP20 family molecular chaperone IbpA
MPPPVQNVRMAPAAEQAQQTMRAFAQMDAFFEQTFSEMAAMERLFDRDAEWDALPVSPFLDMREEGDAYVVVYATPGMTAHNVGVVLDGRILTIAATLPHRHGGAVGARPFTVERHVQLPGPVLSSYEATAVITNGVLRISLPKAAPAPVLKVQPVRLF